MENIINVKNLTRKFSIKVRNEGLRNSINSFFNPVFKEVVAVSDLSFSINEGEIVGFIGSNGAGKTTTLKMLSGLVYPSSGEVSILGFKPHERNEKFLKQISLVMGQKNQLWWDIPVIETFKLNKDIYEIGDKDFNFIFNELIELLDVKHVLNTQVRRLSLGERMKCELIASLLHQPKVLFLDEPTIGLDIIMQKRVREFIKHYNEKYRTTIMLTSHYMEDVNYICERVIVINKGQMIFDGKIKDLIKSDGGFKILTVYFVSKTQFELGGGLGEIINQDELSVSIKVKKENISSLASFIHENYEVDDLDISEPKLEDIIAKMI